MQVRVRIGPSPTGVPHIGVTRTALFNFLFAKKFGGKFIVRIEDTDRERLIPSSIPKILEILKFLGLRWDGKVYFQSQRLAIYQEHAKKLVDSGDAYFCFCTPQRLEKLRTELSQKGMPAKYDRHCLGLSQKEINQKIVGKEKHVIRMKIPAGETLWNDLIHSAISFKNQLLDDQILVKSDSFPTYHLAVVVDDHLAKITHVLRGDEWISSTPKHLILYKFFGWKPPEFGHLPLVLGPDKAKLSKRHGAKSVLEYADEGFLPEALNNFMALLGWSPPASAKASKGEKQQEIFSLAQLIKHFDLAGVNPTSPIFNLEKLNWFNGQWIRRLTNKELAKRIKQYFPEHDLNKIISLVPLVKERMTTLLDFKRLTDFFFKPPEQYPQIRLSGTTISSLATTYEEQISSWKTPLISAGTVTFAETHDIDRKDLFMDIRKIVSGVEVTPPLFESLKKLGKEEVVRRLRTYAKEEKK